MALLFGFLGTLATQQPVNVHRHCLAFCEPGFIEFGVKLIFDFGLCEFTDWQWPHKVFGQILDASGEVHHISHHRGVDALA